MGGNSHATRSTALPLSLLPPPRLVHRANVAATDRRGPGGDRPLGNAQAQSAQSGVITLVYDDASERAFLGYESASQLGGAHPVDISLGSRDEVGAWLQSQADAMRTAEYDHTETWPVRWRS